jgi:hypothetical protein
MRKFLAILFAAFLVSCGKSVVSSRDAIVKKIEINNSFKETNPEKYRIYAEYIEGSLHIVDIIDGRSETNGFVLFTDTKYNVGDTIRLAK